MKKLLPILLFTILIDVAMAQSPSVVKAVLGTPTEPAAKDQEGWKNNEWNGLFFYEGKGTASKLCVTDGTDAGTQLIADIGPGGITATIPARDFMYIITNRYASFSPFMLEAQIWKSNGTSAGTSLVYTMPQSSISNANRWTSDVDIKQNFSVIGNTMFFGGYDAVNGGELWLTDGTAAGTHIVSDIKPGTGNSNPMAFCKIGTEIFFTCTQTGLERKLWKTDGTAAGTMQIAVAEPFFIADYAVGLVNNKMIFYAHNTVDGYEPYVSDGTAAGTLMLKNISPAGNSSVSQAQNAHLRFNSRYCFFIANNGVANALWSTDGTTAGTQQLTTNEQAAWSGISGGSYTDVDETGFWMLDYNGGGSSEKLYFSNGTPTGTYQVASGLSYAQNIKIYKAGLWMAARNAGSVSNVEVWRSGGNMASTNLAFDLAYSTASSTPYGFFIKNGKLHFFASTSSPSGHNLYQYTGDFTFNGTQAGGLWRDSANWNGMLPPGIMDTVRVNNGTAHALQVLGANAYAASMILGNNVNISLPNVSDTLIVSNNVSTAAGNNFTGSGVLSLRNSSSDTVTINGGFTASQLAVESPVALTAGNLTINGNLHLNNSSQLLLNNNSLTMQGTASTIARSGAGFIHTNGMGTLVVENIGPSGRASTVHFPIGAAGNYNPVSISNTGATDHFAARVQPQVFSNYSGEAGVGAPYGTGVVNSNWFIKEAVAGGSNADISLQWNAAQELPGFSRAVSQFGHYMGGVWLLGSATHAAGTDSYTLTGMGITSFSPFAIFNNNVVLPLQLLSFSVNKCNNSQACLHWQTSNEQSVSHFSIERSADGTNFTTISQVPAQNQLFNEYNIYDDIASLQNNPRIFYRLRQTDAGGRSFLSGVIFITSAKDKSVSIYPNPVADMIYTTNWQLIKQAQLIEINGKIIKSWSGNFHQLDVIGVASGTYILHVKLQDGSVRQYKVLKQ